MDLLEERDVESFFIALVPLLLWPRQRYAIVLDVVVEDELVGGVNIGPLSHQCLDEGGEVFLPDRRPCELSQLLDLLVLCLNLVLGQPGVEFRFGSQELLEEVALLLCEDSPEPEQSLDYLAPLVRGADPPRVALAQPGQAPSVVVDDPSIPGQLSLPTQSGDETLAAFFGLFSRWFTFLRILLTVEVDDRVVLRTVREGQSDEALKALDHLREAHQESH